MTLPRRRRSSRLDTKKKRANARERSAAVACRRQPAETTTAQPSSSATRRHAILQRRPRARLSSSAAFDGSEPSTAADHRPRSSLDSGLEPRQVEWQHRCFADRSTAHQHQRIDQPVATCNRSVTLISRSSVGTMIPIIGALLSGDAGDCRGLSAISRLQLRGGRGGDHHHRAAYPEDRAGRCSYGRGGSAAAVRSRS